MKRFVGKLKIIIVFILLLPSIALAITKPHYQKAYIAIYLNGKQVDSFHPAIINKNKTLYLSLNDVVKRWMGVKLIFKGDRYWVRSALLVKSYWLDTHDQYYGLKGELASRYHKNDVVWFHDILYVNINLMSHWLPVTITFNVEQYAAYIDLNYVSPQMLKQQHLMELNVENQTAKVAAKNAALPVMQSDNLFNPEVRYRLNWFSPFTNRQNVNAQFDANVDLFKGTLFATGTGQVSSQGHSMAPIYWNYTFTRPGQFHLLQFGNTFDEGTLLLPIFNLENGINFQRLAQSSGHEGFVYQGHTIPNTEVDVRRNGVLIQVLNSDANGQYTVQYANAVAGDTFVLHLYYKDGSQKIKTIQFAPDNAAILDRHQWDSSFQFGFLPPGSQGLLYANNGYYLHGGLRFGLTRDFTIGLNGYRFPATTTQGAGGVTAAWQMLRGLNLRGELMSDNNSTDYAARINMTEIPFNAVQVNARDINQNSPLNSLIRPSVFQTFPFTDIFSTANSVYSVKDTISIKSWQLTPEYQYTNVGSLASLEALANINRYISFTIASGIAAPKNTARSGFIQATSFFTINPHNLIQLSRNFYQNLGETVLSYRYQSLQEKGWDASIGIAQPDNGNTQLEVDIQWRPVSPLALSLIADQDSVNFQITYLGIFARKPGPNTYDGFATGTLYGRLMAPPLTPDGKPTPLEGAEIEIGPETGKTNKEGYFLIRNIPPNTKEAFRIRPSSLDASLVADKDVVMMRFRPGSFIVYNPKLDWTVGMDGEVENLNALPKNALMDVLKTIGGKPIKEVHIEANGFFVINKLMPGTYYLKLHHVKNAHYEKITIHSNQHWLSNWRYL